MQAKAVSNRRVGPCGIVAASAACLAGWAAPAPAADTGLAGFPLVVLCAFEGITSAYYFSQLQGEQAVYLTLDRQVGTITIDGTAQRVGGDRPGDCADKTLDELRTAGQAFDLPR